MTLPPRTSSLVAAVAAALLTQACSPGRTDLAATARSQRQPSPVTLAAGAAAGDDLATLRAEGPAALARLLAAHDAATGDERVRLAAQVDQVAGQRYATVSRLFWHTELAAAQAAARAAGKPILSLRLLGRLDEDRSCANSRFFRVALYGDAALSAWLRDHFVLHWSSERPVPQVTIDFGDGRRIETTIGGNSGHYVLDADGHVLDVVPGLMTPRAFRQELEGALALAGRLDAGDGAHAAVLERHHQRQRDVIDTLWRQLGATPMPAQTWGSTLAQAQQTAIGKARIELPVVKTARLGRDPSSVAVDSAGWEQIGIRVLAARGLEQVGGAPGDSAGVVLPPPVVLDAQSRALVETLGPVDWRRAGEPLTDDRRAEVIAAFEAAIVADSGLNLTRLRAQIHAEFAARAGAGDPLAFADVNAWLYASVFLTPSDDPWLGMATPGTFTGLPRDGVRVDQGLAAEEMMR